MTYPGLMARQRASSTIYDVAAHAGVSAMTVSRVLNGSASVRPATREKVLASITALDYRANAQARSLRPGRTSQLVGAVITNIDNPYYSRLLLGIEDALRSADRRVVIGMTHGDVQEEKRIIRDLIGHQVEGLIVVPAGKDTSHLLPAARHHTPLVLASRAADVSLEADTVVIADRAGMRGGVSRAITSGARRVLFLGGPAWISTAQRRFLGYSDALTDHGIPLDQALVRRDCTDPETAQSALEETMAAGIAFDAVATTNNRVSLGALRVLMRQAERTGDRPPLVAMDGFDPAGLVEYPILVIDHDPRLLGQTAGSLLLDQIEPSRRTESAGDPSDEGAGQFIVQPTSLHAYGGACDARAPHRERPA